MVRVRTVSWAMKEEKEPSENWEMKLEAERMGCTKNDNERGGMERSSQ